MKSYTITVNGNIYDVTVEEKGQATTPVNAAKTPVMSQAQPVITPVATGGAGNIKVEAGAAGKVFKIEAGVGQKVKAGDTIVILEIMKMETPVVAPKDGTIASIDVNEGQSVEAGALLATMNE